MVPLAKYSTRQVDFNVILQAAILKHWFIYFIYAITDCLFFVHEVYVPPLVLLFVCLFCLWWCWVCFGPSPLGPETEAASEFFILCFHFLLSPCNSLLALFLPFSFTVYSFWLLLERCSCTVGSWQWGRVCFLTQGELWPLIVFLSLALNTWVGFCIVEIPVLACSSASLHLFFFLLFPSSFGWYNIFLGLRGPCPLLMHRDILVSCKSFKKCCWRQLKVRPTECSRWFWSCFFLSF